MKQAVRTEGMHHYGYFYITTNKNNTVLYCGATDDLFKRISEHRNNVFANSFTSRYNVTKLVYYESYTLAGDAFEREKQVKAGSRKKKIELIESINPNWEDLFPQIASGEIEELRKIKNRW